MPTQIPAKFDSRIASAQHVWFTTVREDGMPQPTPVWFVREGDTFLIYTTPDSQKVANIRANPHAALGWATDDTGYFVVAMGTAAIDEAAPPAKQNAAYIDKYTEGIAGIGMTPDSFSEQFSLPVRVMPTQVRGEVEE
jgi:PPOX class probable F420-dependent enzyme